MPWAHLLRQRHPETRLNQVALAQKLTPRRAKPALAMRLRPTPSERLLWSAIRGQRLGIVFRRQQVIGQHIVDFFAPRMALVVEIDGEVYHATQESADAARERKLIRAGYTGLRIPASLVERDLLSAVGLVCDAIVPLR